MRSLLPFVIVLLVIYVIVCSFKPTADNVIVQHAINAECIGLNPCVTVKGTIVITTRHTYFRFDTSRYTFTTRYYYSPTQTAVLESHELTGILQRSGNTLIFSVEPHNRTIKPIKIYYTVSNSVYYDNQIYNRWRRNR